MAVEGSCGNGKMSGEQWWVGNDTSFITAFRVDRIPRFILLDRKGWVSRLEMTRPSDPRTETMLRQLKGIENGPSAPRKQRRLSPCGRPPSNFKCRRMTPGKSRWKLAMGGE